MVFPYRTDLLPKYLTLLSLFQTNKPLAEEFKKVAAETSKPMKSNLSITNKTVESFQDVDDVSCGLLFSCRIKLIKFVYRSGSRSVAQCS